MGGDWATTVTDIVRIFRTALVALVPAMDAARVPWKEPAAYDDWDDIAGCLFKNLVVRSIKWALPDSERSSFRIDDYDPARTSPDVSAGSLIIRHPSVHGSLVFRRLRTIAQPFDTVEAWDEAGTPMRLPFDEVEFAARTAAGPHQKVLEAVTVAL